MRADLEHRHEITIAALLDAYGHERARIAELVGVDVSTISRWRNRDEYKQEVEQWQGRITGALEVRLGNAAIAMIEAGLRGMKVLVEIAETACFEDGSPDNATRDKAATTLYEKLESLYSRVNAVANSDGGAERSNAISQVVINMPGVDVIDVIDQDAVEV